MRLKKIRLAGFKSFVDPTNIPFPDDMTAIVGPNGCGKSNVIDAVRWVLGESSAKNLRGDAMTDVIFNGSSARKPVSQCSVELVFDNSSGRIEGEFARYNELSVKRVVTRDAVSTYYLNSAKCRRRDVTDLFLGTGLGPRSYAIIEQGMISRLIESKPQELRVFIEEAAGVSKYKERRRETENRIRHTRENLERLEDVRVELGQQLDKLQRQAAAARRYKELKAKERKYKAELAAIRWLKHSAVVTELEAKIEQQETDIQKLVAEQRGGETSIIQYRENQADLKQTLSDIQQKIFNLATDITRIEQSQIHAKQRTEQVARESRQAESERTRLIALVAESERNVEALTETVASFEPQIALIDEQIEALNTQLEDEEARFLEKQAQWRQQEQQHNQLKQRIQSTHSQIQSGLQMQLRTEQRIAEIKEEMLGLTATDLQDELASLEAQCIELEEEIEGVLQQVALCDDILNTAKSHHEQSQKAQQSCFQLWQKIKAQCSGLKTLYAEQLKGNDAIENWLSKQPDEMLSFWETLAVEPGWEKAFETALQQWQGAYIAEQAVNETTSGLKILYTDAMSQDKQPDSLASKCMNARCPAWLNSIFIAQSTKDADTLASSLTEAQSVITADGYWRGAGWLINGTGNQNGSILAQANEIKHLEQEVDALSAKHIELEGALDLAAQALSKALSEKQSADQQHLQLKAKQDQSQQQKQFIQQQMARQEKQLERLQADLAVQEEQMAIEQAQLESLNEAIVELEAEQIESGEGGESFEPLREKMQQEIAHLRQSAAQYQSQKHQLALSFQSQQNQYQSEQQNLVRHQSDLKAEEEKLTRLKDEQDTLLLPMEEQSERLAILLDERSEQQVKQAEVSDALSDVEERLLDFEKGREGVQLRIEKAKTVQQSTRVDCEGYKARASAVLEQLQEMQQPLKPLLETLPAEAQEQVWQDELDKTQSALSRLGAVNLAAVEEYEVQAERKQHLDDQNDDLVSALDTLESAIRKIDRETRFRFKETFDQVNDDLKQLFPKVFGGGSAYLDLTEDDLLETGVTIMARPPGKKNSTIHLLSGGEKALTALSLVFAIFRLNPAPFCLLDEVDAPLDDANVGRFCKLVSEMSKSVQFIYITHNKIAMEMALHLTGVTMGEPGVSKVVAVDVEEAVAIVNA